MARGTKMITVYGKPNCVQCTATYKSLDARGHQYQVVDITTNDNALTYVKGELGYLGAPVVVVSERDHWSGFRPDCLERVAAGGATDSETAGV
jgi:glutaredoxin-like protein NrdH